MAYVATIQRNYIIIDESDILVRTLPRDKGTAREEGYLRQVPNQYRVPKLCIVNMLLVQTDFIVAMRYAERKRVVGEGRRFSSYH